MCSLLSYKLFTKFPQVHIGDDDKNTLLNVMDVLNYPPSVKVEKLKDPHGNGLNHWVDEAPHSLCFIKLPGEFHFNVGVDKQV